MSIPKTRNENSDKLPVRPRQAHKTENSVGERILGRLGGRDMAWLAQETGLPLNTLYDSVRRGPAKVDTAMKVARVLGMSLDELMLGTAPSVAIIDGGASEEAMRSVPIVNAIADAGPGALNGYEKTVGQMTFPESDLRRFGTIDQLRLIRARGDSMTPEIRDDDLVMFDLGNTDFRNGVTVINRDGLLVIKRLEMIGGSKARLLSDNRAYDPVDIDLECEQLSIVGRVVWAGKSY